MKIKKFMKKVEKFALRNDFENEYLLFISKKDGKTIRFQHYCNPNATSTNLFIKKILEEMTKEFSK